jgi:hypothetical protein
MSDLVSPALVVRLRYDDCDPTVLPDGSGVLLDLDGHRVVSLSKTGVALVQYIRSGVDSLDALARMLAERYDVEFLEARQDAEDFVNELTRALAPAA